MKIRTKKLDYDKVMSLPGWKNFKPKKPNFIFRFLMKALGSKDLKETSFSFTSENMDKISNNQPCLILMNHSAFIDLEIAATVLFPRPYNIVTTLDGFIGKKWLMRNLGCIPARKFISDTQLVKDIFYSIRKLKTSVLMYPEASYSFDGTQTPIHPSLGKLIKKLCVPVITIKTTGAFLRDPLYNGLKLRNTTVSAKQKCLFTPENCKNLSVSNINKILCDEFTFDHFRHQSENRIVVNEPFRAVGLERVMFKCPHCNNERTLHSEGTTVKCSDCGAEYMLTEIGELENLNGETKFNYVPDWYKWERDCVRKEILEGTYSFEEDVSIGIVKDSKYVYMVGDGHLSHSRNGFHLTGCDGKLDFKTTAKESYSLYSDYFWYEISDVISIGTPDIQYYCFPKNKDVSVAKVRLATEELYKVCTNGN